MKRNRFLFWLCLISLVTVGSYFITARPRPVNEMRAQGVSQRMPTPRGWAVYPPPGTESEDRDCANFSNKAWKVKLTAEELQIDLIPVNSKVIDPLPFEIDPAVIDSGKSGQRITLGDRHVHRADKGWLVGFDAGEWGGALLWSDIDGNGWTKLASVNVVGFTELASSLLIFVSFVHMDIDEGQILRAERDKNNTWVVSSFADLDGAPILFLSGLDDSIIILTTSGLFRLRAPRSIELLLETDYDGLYPNSMVRVQTNVLYIGMRHFVTRVALRDGRWVEEWMVPEDCTRFEVRSDECVCFDDETGRRGSDL